MGTAFRLLGIGWFVAICVLGGGVGGYLLDDRLGLSPLLTLVGLLAGVAVAVTGMYRMIMAVLAEGRRENETRNGR